MSFVTRNIARFLFSYRTRNAVKFELTRLRAKIFGPRSQRKPAFPLMHLASGSRRLPGWVNVDLAGADINIDMTARPFPFVSNSFDAVVTQHLIEHLDIEEEVFPVFDEVFRVIKPGGELWLSTPDMEKICKHYMSDGGQELYQYMMKRDPLSWPEGLPPRFIMNRFFYQRGEHKNLFDFELMKWTLKKCGFADVLRVNEADLLKRFPGFPARYDDLEVLSVKCTKPVEQS